MATKKSHDLLHSQARTIVGSVIRYFYLEKDNMGPVKDVRKVLERVADACCIPERTVRRIKSEMLNQSHDIQTVASNSNDTIETDTTDQEEYIRVASNKSSSKKRVVIRTPRKRKNKPVSRPVTGIDDFTKSAIRRHIIGYYDRREVPTLRKLVVSLKEAELFRGGIASIRYVLRDLGFVYKRFNNRKVLMEKPSVALHRCQFLRKTNKINMESTIFLDETWLNQNIACEKGWTDETVKGTLNTPIGKGKRLIICHAGSNNGWIDAPPLVFQSKKTNDYHEEMNASVFEDWFFKTLLPAIPPKSTIIMDNAPYHSRVKDKAPTSGSTKGEMKKWLEGRGIVVPTDLRRPELYEVVKLHKPPHPTYVIDSKAEEMGFRVIRLPPYHCHYNPIEMIWAHMKDFVKKRNTTFKMKDLEVLFTEAVNNITPELWSKCVSHAKTLMDADWISEGLHDASVKEFIINLCPGDFDSDQSETDSSNTEDENDIGCQPLLQ